MVSQQNKPNRNLNWQSWGFTKTAQAKQETTWHFIPLDVSRACPTSGDPALRRQRLEGAASASWRTHWVLLYLSRLGKEKTWLSSHLKEKTSSLLWHIPPATLLSLATQEFSLGLTQPWLMAPGISLTRNTQNYCGQTGRCCLTGSLAMLPTWPTSLNHGMTELSGLEGSSGDELLQDRVTYSKRHRNVSSEVWTPPDRETPQPSGEGYYRALHPQPK